MNDQQLLRYSRHILLDDIGIEGQQRWLDAHALVIGAGGLGSPVALYLASAGIGTITLVDDDVVDLTNLQRQIMHTTQRIGLPKTVSGKIALAQINPDITVTALTQRAEGEALAQLIASATVVFDCSDNFATRHAINRACVIEGVPLVSGAAIRFEGQISVFDSRDLACPCYACIFPPSAQAEETPCATMGVFAPLVGIIGAMQASEGLKIIAGVGVLLAGRLLMFDGRSCQWSSIAVARDPNCDVCGQRVPNSLS